MQELKANTAVDILIGPFVDATDGYTAEEALSPSVLLSKNGQTLAAKNDVTTPTHDDAGYYNCELDATDTNTEGTLDVVIEGNATHLPVRLSLVVLSQAAWDSKYAAKDTGYMDVNIKAVSEDTVAADNLELACDNYSATRGLAGTALPAAAADAAGGLPISDSGGLDLDTMNSTINTTSSNVTTVDTVVDAIKVVTDAQGATGTGLTAVPWNAAWDAEVQSEAEEALVTYGLDHLISAALPTDWATDVASGSVFDNIADNGTAAFDRTTDSLQAIRDAGGGDATAANQTTIINAIGTMTDLGGGADIANNLADMAGATFATGTDSLEAIRDRGDAAWTTGAGTGLSSLASGTAQAGAAGTITLAAGATATDDFYNKTRILTTGGTGAGQSRAITDYNGTTKVATVSPNWTTNPDATTTYEIQASDANLLAATQTSIDAIEADTNELQGDWANDGRLDLILDATATASALATAQTDLDTITGTDGVTLATAQANYAPATAAALATAQTDLDTLTGTDGVTLATSQPNYAPATAAAMATAQADLDIITGADGVNLLSATQASIDAIETDTNALNDTKVPDTISLANINAQVDTAIETYHLDHLLAVDYDPATPPGVATALLNELIESDAGVSRFTANALENASGGSLTEAGIADAVWDESRTGHTDAGTFGLFLDAQITGVGGAVGSGAVEHTVTVNEGGDPSDGAEVWVTTDEPGVNVVAGTLSTDAFGQATFMLDAGSYYLWAQKSGVNFTNPTSFSVS